MSMNSSSENRNSTKVSKPSVQLSNEENEIVYRLVGRRCTTMCTAVAQLYQTESPSHTRWSKKCTGALCFIKDNAKRSYYCRIFCLMRHEMVWEQEMYDTIDIVRTRPYLLTFEGQDGIVGLNFAFEQEAETFLQCAMLTVANRNRRREERRQRVRKEPPARPPPITNNINNNQMNQSADDGAVTLRNPASITKLAPPHQPPYQPPQSIFNNIRNKKRDGSKKLTKADIGTPSNFKHVTHVGWNATSGFDLSGEDESLKPFLKKAGVSKDQLEDRRTRNFIYDFIQSHKVEEVMRQEKKTKPTAPPVPTRHQNQNGEKSSQRTAPPPPPTKDFGEKERPTRELQPPHPNSFLIQKNQIAPPPCPNEKDPRNTQPPPSNTQPPIAQNNARPPPPPPPMMPAPPPAPPMITTDSPEKLSGPKLPVIPDTRNMLMESIRKGAQLKKVEASSSSGGDSRNNLLSAIHKGVELRPVGDRPIGNRSSSEIGTDALADALRKALEARHLAVAGDSSSSSGENSDDGEWSD